LKNISIHEKAIVESSAIGDDTKISAFAHVLEGARLGKNCSVDDHAFIEGDVIIGDNVRIGNNTIIRNNVVIGDNSFIGPDCILGEPLAAFYTDKSYENPPLKIGKNSIIRSHSVIYAGSTFGDGLETGHRVTIRERSILGKCCRVGTLCEIQGYVEIGNYCRLHSNVHIAQTSTIRDYAWIFPHVVLTNDPHPPSDTCIKGPTIEEYAVIATASIIMPAIKIGRDSVVGAQSLVNRDVAPETVVVGVPAKVLYSIHDVRCKEGRLQKVYPWRHHYSRGYPWEKRE